MRVASIDIGTNSVLLLVAERRKDGGLSALLEKATITRLGEGVDKSRTLAPAAVDRTLACLQTYADAIRELGVDRIEVVGTSAMRDAAGGDAFREQATAILGATPRTISGDEEASLTFIGALSGLPYRGDITVFDIGGGIRNEADAWAALSDIAVLAGRTEEGLEHIRKAFRLNPFPASWYYLTLGQAQYAAGEYAAAIETLRRDETYRTSSRRFLAASLASSQLHLDPTVALIAGTRDALFLGKLVDIRAQARISFC